jgi:hypothetical protein
MHASELQKPDGVLDKNRVKSQGIDQKRFV